MKEINILEYTLGGRRIKPSQKKALAMQKFPEFKNHNHFWD